MFINRFCRPLIYLFLFILPVVAIANSVDKPVTIKQKTVIISNPKITMMLDYGDKASITSLIINGQKVISGVEGIYTSVNVGGTTYSSLHLTGTPLLVKQG